jgi:hypothetical protein
MLAILSTLFSTNKSWQKRDPLREYLSTQVPSLAYNLSSLPLITDIDQIANYNYYSLENLPYIPTKMLAFANNACVLLYSSVQQF